MSAFDQRLKLIEQSAIVLSRKGCEVAAAVVVYERIKTARVICVELELDASEHLIPVFEALGQEALRFEQSGVI